MEFGWIIRRDYEYLSSWPGIRHWFIHGDLFFPKKRTNKYMRRCRHGHMPRLRHRHSHSHSRSHDRCHRPLTHTVSVELPWFGTPAPPDKPQTLVQTSTANRRGVKQGTRNKTSRIDSHPYCSFNSVRSVFYVSLHAHLPPLPPFLIPLDQLSISPSLLHCKRHSSPGH